MNLSPLWVEAFNAEGFEAVHWSTFGDPGAPDLDIMQWAPNEDHVVSYPNG